MISPLVLLVPIILVTALAGKFDLSRISPVFAMGAGVIYCVTAVFYVSLCRAGKAREATPVALVADGALVVFFSSSFDCGPVFIFAGFIVVIAGIFAGIYVAVPSGGGMFARKADSILPNDVGVVELQRIIDSIQFPCVFMERGDEGEQIAAFNQSFAESFGLDKGAILGRQLESLLPVERGKSQMTHGDEEWVVKRTAKGRQTLVMLSPVMKSKEAAKIEVFDAIDVSTGLYTAGFMRYKARADIESANRGKRRLSAALFKLTFPPGSTLGISDDEQTLAAVVMGRVIQQAIRVSDSAFRTSDDEVLLLMPDTPDLGSKIVISRVYAMSKQMAAVECPSLTKAIIDCVNRDYVGGTDLPPYDKILSELYTLLYRKHPDLAPEVAAIRE
jgi:hypothetical protein